MNIFYIGSAGALSLIPFRYLLAENYNLLAVGVDNPVTVDNKIIALENEPLSLAANAMDIPVIDLSLPVAEIISLCAGYSIDVILMACYSKRLPDEIIQLANFGCYNMHPSLLPVFRGPEPVFWQMKNASDIGVSWHFVVKEFDAGNVLCQKKILLDDGATYSTICLQLAEAGAQLMLKMLANIKQSVSLSSPQDSAMASYFHYPQSQDFNIDLNHSAQQLYNFMCATQAFAQPFLCETDGYRFYLSKAIDFDNNLSLSIVEVHQNTLYIPCNDGVLMATYTDKIAI